MSNHIPKIAAPVQYKRCIIAPAAGAKGFDVFDGSGRWFNAPTQRQAKWWAAVKCTLEDRMGENPTRPVPRPQTP